MTARTPAQGSERYLDFTNAQGLCFRMQVEDDPFDACAFTVRVTPLQGHGESNASQPAFSQHALLSALTSRERDVALLIAEGFTNDQIALRLCIRTSSPKPTCPTARRSSPYCTTRHASLCAAPHQAEHRRREVEGYRQEASHPPPERRTRGALLGSRSTLAKAFSQKAPLRTSSPAAP